MIDKQTIIEVIKDFSEWEPPSLVEREVEVPLSLKIRRAVSIVGPRRAGKTFLMYQLIRRLLGRGVPRRRILYVNFEDYRLFGADFRDMAEIVDTFYELYPPRKGEKIWFFLDEVQNVPGWERVVRTLVDSGNVQVYVTGSSSKLLSLELATQLRGRTLVYEVYPFSFREFLRARGIEADPHPSSRQRYEIMNALSEYLEWGGYPEAVLEPEQRERILQEIWEVTVSRDIVERWKIRNTRVLRLLIRAVQESREFSIHRFYIYLKSLGIRVSKNTLYTYLEHLYDALVAFPLRKLSPSYKALEASIPKIYLVDNGLYAEKEKGRLLENLVFMELKRRGFKENVSLFYWRDPLGREVDFVLRKSTGRYELIQVAYQVTHSNMLRETSSLEKASKQLGRASGLIVTWDQEGVLGEGGVAARAVPLWRWLLGMGGRKNLSVGRGE